MDRISGFVFFSLGIYILWQERHLSFGRLSAPGPRFFPTVLAIILIILSLFLIISGGKKENPVQSFSVRSAGRGLSVFASALAYFFSFEYLGFLITGFLLMIFLFIVVGSEKWHRAAMYAFISIGLTYLIFVALLKVTLPQGILGF